MSTGDHPRTRAGSLTVRPQCGAPTEPPRRLPSHQTVRCKFSAGAVRAGAGAGSRGGAWGGRPIGGLLTRTADGAAHVLLVDPVVHEQHPREEAGNTAHGGDLFELNEELLDGDGGAPLHGKRV